MAQQIAEAEVEIMIMHTMYAATAMGRRHMRRQWHKKVRARQRHAKVCRRLLKTESTAFLCVSALPLGRYIGAVGILARISSTRTNTHIHTSSFTCYIWASGRYSRYMREANKYSIAVIKINYVWAETAHVGCTDAHENNADEKCLFVGQHEGIAATPASINRQRQQWLSAAKATRRSRFARCKRWHPANSGKNMHRLK